MSRAERHRPSETGRVDLHRAGGPIPRTGNARTTWDRRDSVIVALHDGEGRVGLGEAAPLPGLGCGEVDLVKLGERVATSPAASFALEQAELDLRGQREGVPLHRLLDPAPPPRAIEVSALLGDPRATDAIDRATRHVRSGARTLKLKLGCGTIDDDVRAVAALRESIGRDVVLLGDANGAWTAAQARSALERLAPFDFDYVEQPVAPADLPQLGRVAIPVWADESLVEADLCEQAMNAADVAGVVCKPTMLGGLASSVRLARRAHAMGKRVVVTHALEGPVALAGCAALALALGGIAPRAGIWPHDALAAYPAVALPGYADGRLVATGRPGLGFSDEERRQILALPKVGDRP